MNKLLTATVLAASLLSSVSHAGALKDYSDRSVQTCDKDDITAGLESLWDNGAAHAVGLSLLYVKGEPVETLRKTNELRCRVVLVTSKGPMTGVFNWINQDGHALYGFAPGKSK
jgi:hypothetical protein